MEGSALETVALANCNSLLFSEPLDSVAGP